MGSRFEAGTTATYSFLTGFAVTEDVVRTCEGHPAGLWNGTAPTCNGISIKHSHLLFYSHVCNINYSTEHHHFVIFKFKAYLPHKNDVWVNFAPFAAMY